MLRGHKVPLKVPAATWGRGAAGASCSAGDWPAHCHYQPRMQALPNSDVPWAAHPTLPCDWQGNELSMLLQVMN